MNEWMDEWNYRSRDGVVLYDFLRALCPSERGGAGMIANEETVKHI